MDQNKRQRRNRRRKQKRLVSRENLHENKQERMAVSADVQAEEEFLKHSDDLSREALKQAKELFKDETEVFISNIPYSVHASSLMQFINNNVGVTGGVTVVRCQILEKKLHHSGAALVLLKSRKYFDKLLSIKSTLVLQGRLLNVREGDGRSRNRRRVKDNKLCFAISNIQLSPSISNYSTNDRNVDWHYTNSTSVEFDDIKHAITIPFQIESIKYKIVIPVRFIRDVQISRDVLTSNLILMFRITQRPYLYRDKSIGTEVNFQEMLFGFSKITIPSLLKGIKSKLLWELDWDDDNVDDLEWVRTVDPTIEKAFQRCQLYILTLNSISFDININNILKVLHSQTKTIREIVNGPLLNHRNISYDNDVQMCWKQLHNGTLPFSTLYLLDCLIGANKFDLFSFNGITKELLDIVKGKISILNKLLKQLFIDRRVVFIENILLTLHHKYNHLILDPDEMNDLDTIFEEEIGMDVIDKTMLVRRVFITPLAVLPYPPERETTNRIIRKYQQYSDRFLRVAFVDEELGSILQASSDDIFTKCLTGSVSEGILIAGRRFNFLAYSNSQIREHSCWFYDESIQIGENVIPPSADEIRAWVGDLSSIKIPGKYAARLGQAFSDTVSTLNIPFHKSILIPDIERNGYCFSDGVGLISYRFAKEVSLTYGLNFIPSAYQIRFGGSKGVLSVHPDDHPKLQLHDVAFRPTMMKFTSSHRELEICTYSRRNPLYLNRQMIIILSSRGIPDHVFLHLLEYTIQEFDLSLTDNDHALDLIYAHCHVGYHSSSISSHSYAPMASVSALLEAGIDVSNDWYLKGTLHALRNRLLLDVQNRSRILVPQGVCLIGIMDETNILKQGEVFIQLSGRKGEENKVLIYPKIAVGRSPLLHPGDIRVLTACDVPQLRHLVDVVVFPSQGHRPHPNEMSGGDLDGDLYFIIWDHLLIPLTDYPAMEYQPPPAPITTNENVTIKDIQHFFVNYIKNDNLGQIANAHVVHADFDSNGAKCDSCLKLAQLHSTAVDFIKTGVPAIFPRELHMPKYPSFMNASKYKVSYESDKVLGMIHRRCQTKKMTMSEYKTCYEKGIFGLDSELLLDGYTVYIQDAVPVMIDYNEAIWELMKRFHVWDEMELLSGFVSSFTRRSGDNGGRRGADEQARLNAAVKRVRQSFYDRFWDELLDDSVPDEQSHPMGIAASEVPIASSADDEERNVPFHDEEPEPDATSVPQSEQRVIDTKAMRKASAWYYCAYSQEPGDQLSPPLISFPWVVYSVLCQLKMSQKCK